MYRATLTALALVLVPAMAFADERASTKEAEGMVHNAVAFMPRRKERRRQLPRTERSEGAIHLSRRIIRP